MHKGTVAVMTISALLFAGALFGWGFYSTGVHASKGMADAAALSAACAVAAACASTHTEAATKGVSISQTVTFPCPVVLNASGQRVSAYVDLPPRSSTAEVTLNSTIYSTLSIAPFQAAATCVNVTANPDGTVVIYRVGSTTHG